LSNGVKGALPLRDDHAAIR